MLKGLVRVLAAAAAVLSSTAASQAAWPERTVTIVVPFSAGGITDVLARLTAERLQAAYKQTFIVENQPGGAGVIAAERIAKAPADGYLLLFAPVFQLTMAPYTHTVAFDPVKDFKPIAAVASSPFVITVGGSFPANTLAEFIAYVKARPGQVTFASAGAGSLTHVTSASFLQSAGLNMVHVPYRGVAPAFTDLIAGHVAMLAPSPVELKPFLESKKVKPLAVTSLERSKRLPNVPTVNETLKSPPSVTYNGLFAPAQTPAEVIDAISRELISAEKGTEFQNKLVAIGVDPIVTTPEQFSKIFADDTEQWRDIVRSLNLKSQ